MNGPCEAMQEQIAGYVPGALRELHEVLTARGDAE
jgi:hypothetical protein